MKIKKFFENEELEEFYPDQLKSNKEEYDLRKENNFRKIEERVGNALNSSTKTKDKLFLQELEYLLDKHGY